MSLVMVTVYNVNADFVSGLPLHLIFESFLIKPCDVYSFHCPSYTILRLSHYKNQVGIFNHHD